MATIDENITTLAQIKADIKEAINNKGVEAGDDITVYGDKIREISGGGDDVDYLCFEAIEDSAISLTVYGNAHPKFEYSFDKETWTMLDYEDNIDVLEGLKLYFRGDNPNGFNVVNDFNSATIFNGTGSFNLSGNIMTLLDMTGNMIELPTDGNEATKHLTFYKLFCENTSIRDCRDLIIPATDAKNRCFHSMFYASSIIWPPQIYTTIARDYSFGMMFYDCSSLKEAPYLRVKDLIYIATTDGPFNECFVNCSSLQYVKAEFTPSTKTSATWLKSASSTGCFIKASDATWTTKSTSTCPSGWTLIKSVS